MSVYLRHPTKTFAIQNRRTKNPFRFSSSRQPHLLLEDAVAAKTATTKKKQTTPEQPTFQEQKRKPQYFPVYPTTVRYFVVHLRVLVGSDEDEQQQQ